MEDLGVAHVCSGRPIKFLPLADWTWAPTDGSPFILFVAAEASTDEEIEIRRFAGEAVEAGCAYVCAWGTGCGFVHDVFDLAAIDAGRDVMSSLHDNESLADALWFALCDAWPDEAAFANAGDATVILAVQEPWLADVRRLIADQGELAKLALGDRD